MGRRKPEPEEKKGDDFIVLFTALSMILLAFFIMLNTMASVDQSRTRKVLNSLVGTFGSLPGFEKSGDGMDFPYKTSPENDDGRVFVERARGLFPRDNSGVELDLDKQGRVVLRLSNDVFFDSGGIQLHPRSFATLDRVAKLVMEFGVKTRIEGHSDPSPTNRFGKTNWYISAARAGAVYRYLVAAGGVPHQLVEAAGYAATRAPKVHNKDRRVEIVFIPDGA
jgi:chemotaxis protein MotB